jgi:hypothetical protein
MKIMEPGRRGVNVVPPTGTQLSLFGLAEAVAVLAWDKYPGLAVALAVTAVVALGKTITHRNR